MVVAWGFSIEIENQVYAIVIQSIIAKLFESLILEVLSFKFKSTFILEQHGFRSGKSTTTNLWMKVWRFLKYLTNCTMQVKLLMCISEKIYM